ncbi:myelin and lymphocyte protein-like [Gouania willdenowi]|uniref:Myelin and lymphocyte protein n=1 Tax=Gouania willdenowi TaxID=441366 RepID=A0A8C5E5G6_GOUWI|nr:myelin and lymphocyte protein-like [Gouania willdenowi]
MASTTSGDILPSGGRVFMTFPDIFFIPEFVFGGLVWILVASTRVDAPNPLGWVMFVSVFCFVGTTLWFFIFICGGNQSSVWPSLDVGFHFLAAVFYLSAGVDLAYITFIYGEALKVLSSDAALKIYRLDIAAVVMCYVAILLYFIHAIFSAIRWKRS